LELSFSYPFDLYLKKSLCALCVSVVNKQNYMEPSQKSPTAWDKFPKAWDKYAEPLQKSVEKRTEKVKKAKRKWLLNGIIKYNSE